MQIPSIYFGLFLGLLMPTVVKLVKQTQSIWKRTHGRAFANVYLYMVWIEAVVNLIFSITTYLFICGVIPVGLPYFLTAVTLWMIQTQLLSQIIANRVALIMVSKRQALKLKFGLFVIILAVNISVYIIWIPAHMPSATPSSILLDNIWERVDKSFFLLVDFGLNMYFLYMIRYRLIADGMTKYWRLFNFNAAIVGVSLSMDALLLGMLSLPNPFDYVQFAPIAYIVKLYIELTMADLISKVVRSGNVERGDAGYYSGHHTGSRNHPNSGSHSTSRPKMPSDSVFSSTVRMDTNIVGGRTDRLKEEDEGEGIMKTTVTTVVKSEPIGTEHPVPGKRLTGDFSSTKSLCADGASTTSF